ncbi:Sec-independent protein translocase protein TatB [Tabrizicola sp.]|uniref:Sec-independent protein translocase protein TatB n=1 Tax=Tabrizicola sp. TaxID=2005166 RepID=UPI002FDD63E3
MFDIGWMELMVIGVVALIVVGPKDMPEMFRQLGRFMAKIRAMGREFSRAMEQAAKESGVDEVRRDLKTVTNPVSTGMQSLKSAADKFEKWDPVKNAARPSTPVKPAAPLTPAPMPPAQPQAAAPAVDPVAPGPATQALIDKQAARKAIMDEMNAKLKALDAGEAPGADKPAKAPGRRRKAKGDEA